MPELLPPNQKDQIEVVNQIGEFTTMFRGVELCTTKSCSHVFWFYRKMFQKI